MTFVQYGPAQVDASPAPVDARAATATAPIDFRADGRFKVEEFTY